MDHICYRVASQQQYQEMKERLLLASNLLIESQIGGRLISTFKLLEPFVYDERVIEVIELPQVKKGSHYKSGFEHAEFVIDKDFEVFSKNLPFDFDWSASKKEHNPELKLKLPTGHTIKLHHKPLDEVIREEKQRSQGN